jgi:hypothetical protein
MTKWCCGNEAVAETEKVVVLMGSVAPEPDRPARLGLVVVGPSRWQWFDPYAGRGTRPPAAKRSHNDDAAR